MINLKAVSVLRSPFSVLRSNLHIRRHFSILIIFTAIILCFTACPNGDCTHQWQWKETDPSTCAAAGAEIETCTKCQETKGESRPKDTLAHGFDSGVCSECDFICPHSAYENNECTVCGEIEPICLCEEGTILIEGIDEACGAYCEIEKVVGIRLGTDYGNIPVLGTPASALIDIIKAGFDGLASGGTAPNNGTPEKQAWAIANINKINIVDPAGATAIVTDGGGWSLNVKEDAANGNAIRGPLLVWVNANSGLVP